MPTTHRKKRRTLQIPMRRIRSFYSAGAGGECHGSQKRGRRLCVHETRKLFKGLRDNIIVTIATTRFPGSRICRRDTWGVIIGKNDYVLSTESWYTLFNFLGRQRHFYLRIANARAPRGRK